MTMLIFQDPADIPEEEMIEDRAVPLTRSVGKNLFSVGALAGLGFLVGGPVVAAAAALLPAWNLYGDLVRDSQNKTWLRRNPGCLAHLIANKTDMLAWIELQGAEEVKEQLLFARKRGQKLTAIARKTLAEMVPADQLPAADLIGAVRALLPESPVTVSPPALPVTLTPGDRAALIQQLEQDCPALLKLIKSHPIRLVGVQRSGKSTFATVLCLLRMLLLENHQVTAATPHIEPGKPRPYPPQFQLLGITSDGARDYDAIIDAWADMAAAVYASKQANRTYIWDEFGLYGGVFGETPKGEPDPLGEVLTSVLRETMKFEIYPIFIVHGETAAFLPGVKGLVKPFLTGTVRVETVGESVSGDDGLPTIRPTGKFRVAFLDGTEEESQLPEWLTEDYLLGLLGGVQGHGYQGANPQVPAVPFGEPEHPTAAPTQGTGFYYRGPMPQVPQQASNPEVPVVQVLQPECHDGEPVAPLAQTAIQPPVGAQVPVPGPGSTPENAIFTPESDAFDADLGEPEPAPGEPRLPPAVFRLKEKDGNYIAAIELVYGVTRGRGRAYKQAKQECDEWLAKQGGQDDET